MTDIDTDVIHRGLDEETIRLISAKKQEPEWLLDFRLKAFRYWQTLEMPNWALLKIPPIDYQDIIYYAAPKKKEGPKSMDEVDPELLKTFDKLGIPLEEQKVLSGMAVDAPGGERYHLLLLQRGGTASSGFGTEVFGERRKLSR